MIGHASDNTLLDLQKSDQIISHLEISCETKSLIFFFYIIYINIKQTSSHSTSYF